jgi:peptidase M28-like protein
MRARLAALLLALPGVALAQRAQAPARGAASITTADVQRRINTIAADSMRGRATPSPELEEVAGYVAAEFRRLKLRPGGDSGTFLQRYPLEVYRFQPDSSALRASGRATASWRVGSDVLLVQGEAPTGPVSAPVVVVTGSPQSGGSLDSAAVTGKLVILSFGPELNAIAGKMLPLKPLAVLLVGNLPDSLWAQFPGREAGIRVKNPNEAGGMPIPAIFATRIGTVGPWLAQTGLSPDSLPSWGEGPLRARPIADVTIQIDVWQRLVERASAPNVVGILEGSDPTLKREYVVYSAHMDHIGTPQDGMGCTAQGADSICNGADDDGSGTVAVLELAEAFATAAVRPKRSVVFMTVSGEERGLWGSAYFTDHPAVPLASVIADLNTDMVGRNAPDTMSVIGREHSDLGAVVDRVAAAHPELHLHPVGDLWPQEGLFFRSDHFNFAKHGVPILFFTSGLHPDYHKVTDAPAALDADKVARYARLAYYVGMDVANAAGRPKWNPESYKQIVTGAGGVP